MNPATIGINEIQPSEAHMIMQRIINTIVGILFVFVAGLAPAWFKLKSRNKAYNAIRIMCFSIHPLSVSSSRIASHRSRIVLKQ